MKSIESMKINIDVRMDLKNRAAKQAPKLLARQIFTDSGPSIYNVTFAPAGATCGIVRGIGCGGKITGVGNPAAGGSGAYAYAFFQCVPNERLVYSAGGADFGNVPSMLARSPATINQANNVPGDIFFRAAHASEVSNTAGVGGSAANCVGDFVEAGMPALVSSNEYSEGGYFGGENRSDILIFGGKAAIGAGTNGNDGQGYGAGGARSGVTGSRLFKHQGGILIIEFYNTDPRGLII